MKGPQAAIQIELERAPDPTQRPGPEEKIAVNNANILHYPGPNSGQSFLTRTNFNLRGHKTDVNNILIDCGF